jgi:hypothetical protein
VAGADRFGFVAQQVGWFKCLGFTATLTAATEHSKRMRTPNPGFERQTPIRVIERGEAERISRMIFQLDAGLCHCFFRERVKQYREQPSLRGE